MEVVGRVKIPLEFVVGKLKSEEWSGSRRVRSGGKMDRCNEGGPQVDRSVGAVGKCSVE